MKPVVIITCFVIVTNIFLWVNYYHKQQNDILYVLYTNQTEAKMKPNFPRYMLCPLNNRNQCLHEVRKLRPKYALMLDYDSEQIVGIIPELHEIDTMYYVPIKSDIYTWLKPLILPQIALDICSYTGKILDCPPELPRRDIFHFFVQESIVDYALEIPYYSETKHQVHLGKVYEYLNVTGTALLWYNESKSCYGLYRMAVISKHEDDFYKAYACNPFRKEPLYYLAKIARAQEKWATCLLYSSAGILVTNTPHRDELYIEFNIYDWALYEQHAECLFFVNNFEEAAYYWKQALKATNIPTDSFNRIKHNLEHTNNKNKFF